MSVGSGPTHSNVGLVGKKPRMSIKPGPIFLGTPAGEVARWSTWSYPLWPSPLGSTHCAQAGATHPVHLEGLYLSHTAGYFGPQGAHWSTQPHVRAGGHSCTSLSLTGHVAEPARGGRWPQSTYRAITHADVKFPRQLQGQMPNLPQVNAAGVTRERGRCRHRLRQQLGKAPRVSSVQGRISRPLSPWLDSSFLETPSRLTE